MYDGMAGAWHINALLHLLRSPHCLFWCSRVLVIHQTQSPSISCTHTPSVSFTLASPKSSCIPNHHGGHQEENAYAETGQGECT